MRYSAELSTISREQKTSKGLKEKAPSSQADRTSESTECSMMGNPLYVSQHHERRQSLGEEPIFQQHSLMDYKKQWLESMVYKNEDLVKHGRNLPGYLQCEGRSKSTQDKTFNLGVLDWGRLENWKSNTKRTMKASLLGNNLALESGSPRLSTSINDSVPQWDQQALNGLQLHSTCIEKLPTGARPRGKGCEPFVGRMVSNSIQSSETDPGRIPDGVRTFCWKNGSSDSNGQQAEEMITSERESSFQDSRKYGSRHSSHGTMMSHPSANKMPSEENIDHDDLGLSGHKNVLFSLGDSHASSSNEHSLSESSESHDGILAGVNERRLSDCFSLEDFHPLNSSVEIQHSCPFPLGTNPSVEQLTTVEDCMKFDLDRGEQPSLKGRHSSFNRRVSFSLDKMAKSFSFKTSSAFPQLSSTYNSLKTRPVTFGSSPDLHNYNSKKGNATNIVRSIPMRRLLDTLKHKGRQHAEKVEQSNGNLISTIIDPSYQKTPTHKQQQKSCKALLQLTMKSGIPFFKLVVDSNSNILAATVKKLPSGKDDSSLTYTFYSVHEIKKKNGRRKNQDSIEKGCGFGYNIVGQMKISSSYHAEFSGLERDLFVVRESVLYGPDSAQLDQITSDCKLTAELATIIVKNTSNENCGGIGSSKSTIVILPGGIHSLPNNGQPSPLINRWRSGGACDCGGWDIGCQLHVLTNQSESITIPNPSTSDRLELCYQGRHNNKPAFSLGPVENGVYSLEYNASISLLQAFSICVAVVSSQSLTHIFQVNHHLQDFSKPIITRYEKVKNRTTVHAKIPPISPIGRV